MSSEQIVPSVNGTDRWSVTTDAGTGTVTRTYEGALTLSDRWVIIRSPAKVAVFPAFTVRRVETAARG